MQTKEPPQIAGKELQEEGYLLEVNRRFFHPLGLAMFVDNDEDYIIGVYDWRDDPEGGLFGSLADEGDDEKFENVRKKWDEKALVRQERYGWVVQPMGTVIEVDDNGDYIIEYR